MYIFIYLYNGSKLYPHFSCPPVSGAILVLRSSESCRDWQPGAWAEEFRNCLGKLSEILCFKNRKT